MIYKLKKNIPNIITITRIISLILGFTFFLKSKIILSLIFYIYGAISDALDGYLARKLSSYSDLGKYLDAISDKLYFISLMIILLIYKYYLVLLPLIMELFIVIINYKTLKKRNKVYTERVGKFKTTLLMIDLILGIISIKIKGFIIPTIILYPLVLYFELQTILSYINQLNKESEEQIINFKGKKVKEKIKLLLEEFIYYIKRPVRIK